MSARKGTMLDTEALYLAIDRRRRREHISFREILRQAGIPTVSQLTRLGQGKPPDSENLIRLMLWLGETDLKPYLAPDALANRDQP